MLAISQFQYPLGSVPYQGTSAQGGNPNLNPEKAVTTSFGVVLTPEWVPGLSVSLDWYNIDIHGGIYSTDTQTIINRCVQGETVYCGFLHIDTVANSHGTQAPAGSPYQVDQFPVNAADVKTSGLDFQANYTMDLFEGKLDWYLVGNYVDEQNPDRGRHHL